jgi:hypothetical protein
MVRSSEQRALRQEQMREKQLLSVGNGPGASGMLYYTIRDVAEELRISYSKARDLVKDEPGILNLSNGKRKLRRIPSEVYERILRRALA